MNVQQSKTVSVNIHSTQHKKLIRMLRSPNLAPDTIVVIFARIYTAAEDDPDIKREAIRVFREHHPETAKNFFATIRFPSELFPENAPAEIST